MTRSVWWSQGEDFKPQKSLYKLSSTEVVGAAWDTFRCSNRTVNSNIHKWINHNTKLWNKRPQNSPNHNPQ